ncbi:sphingosine-1-phosphate phosphatase 1 [Etheostoma spectabile]|uniref:sphingosine-1-phosphate phosphatase 1 n=1 Tax=Etheostoma spectabile TaxID=54343 RepID=UPI0013AFB3D7|nr:sphingosine-1-phosphate phosphatase 1-like [Etheostoma spectabile]
MEKSNRFVELYRYLQDPHLVARFQRFCGVRGSFSRTVCAGSNVTSSKEADRTYSHNNGACHHHITGENESVNLAVIGAGEGEKVQTAALAVRKRITDSNVPKNRGEESENAPQNGALVSASTAKGETVGVGSNSRSLAGATAADQGGHSRVPTDFSEATETEEREAGKSSPVKPLRKNSLTGDAGQEFLIENRFLYYMFTFGTELGNELFYITFFPFVVWNVDAFVGRRLIMVWVWVMYLGQCTKDVIRWSRPASPPVVKVEMFYNSEYSMPSTHAMSGTAIPFSLFFMTYGRWEYPFSLGFCLAPCWCLLVCVSRIYMGMHSVLDVIAGVLYSGLILLVFLPLLDLIDGFNLTCRYAPLIIICLHLGLGLFSFTLDTWSTSRGDTAQILGTGAGVALASHVNHYLGLMPDPTPDQLPFALPGLSAGLAGAAVLRLVLGVLVLMATRALMKAVTIPLVCRVFGVPSTDVRKARQHMEVELPYRYLVYGAVGFNVLFLVPFLFSCIRLS